MSWRSLEASAHSRELMPAPTPSAPTANGASGLVEVFPALYIGNQHDFETEVDGQPGWAVVQACKEPFHRRAVGYRGNIDPSHPEFLFAHRGNRLVLNMVDSDNPKYFSKHLIEPALQFMADRLMAGQKVLVHCNQGRSRAPTLALMFLGRHSAEFRLSFGAAASLFKARYPIYAPARGIEAFAAANWRWFTIYTPRDLEIVAGEQGNKQKCRS